MTNQFPGIHEDRQSYYRDELSSSVDDLKSALGCNYTTPEKLPRLRELLSMCPESAPSKRALIERQVRKLEGMAASAPKIAAKVYTCGVCQEIFDMPDWRDGHLCPGAAPAVVAAPYFHAPIGEEGTLTVMPKTQTLDDVEAQIRELQHTFSEKTRTYHNEVIYDVVAIGLYALKGRDIHLAQAISQATNLKRGRNSPGVETVSTPGETGFLVWVGKVFPQTSHRTLSNYMNAARNVGLTSDSTLEDVDALRKAEALHHRKPTDLYRLAKELQNPEPAGKPAQGIDLVRAWQADFFGSLDQGLALKEEMEPEVYESVCSRMKASMEKLTGHRWEMVNELPGADGEHGQMGTVKL